MVSPLWINSLSCLYLCLYSLRRPDDGSDHDRNTLVISSMESNTFYQNAFVGVSVYYSLMLGFASYKVQRKFEASNLAVRLGSVFR